MAGLKAYLRSRLAPVIDQRIRWDLDIDKSIVDHPSPNIRDPSVFNPRACNVRSAKLAKISRVKYPF